MQALARLEAAALGLPSLHKPQMGAGGGIGGDGAPAAVGGLLVGGGRQERAARWAQGHLARALEERQDRIRWAAMRAGVALQSRHSIGLAQMQGARL